MKRNRQSKTKRENRSVCGEVEATEASGGWEKGGETRLESASGREPQGEEASEESKWQSILQTASEDCAAAAKEPAIHGSVRLCIIIIPPATAPSHPF